MSRESKARRDARRKLTPAPKVRRVPLLQRHAELAVDGGVVGVVSRQESEWTLLLDGRALPPTDSAAMTMAMLRHAAAVREQDGGDVRLAYSSTLREAATLEAQEAGMTLHAYLDALEAERQERREQRAVAAAGRRH